MVVGTVHWWPTLVSVGGLSISSRFNVDLEWLVNAYSSHSIHEAMDVGPL